MLNNFGGNVNLFGRMDGVASGPALALHDPGAGLLRGIGLTMEGIEQNPVIYELMTQHVWQDTVIDPSVWLRRYIRNRYGTVDKRAVEAWEVLRATVYNGTVIRDGAESIITGRPTFDSTTIWTRTRLNYEPLALLPAWDRLVDCVPLYGGRDGFQYDLVDVTRQVLANYALPLQRKWVAAFRARDAHAFSVYSSAFMELIGDMDRLLGTRKDFLLGPWIADAQRWGKTRAEKDLYAMNARDLITLWGDANSPLHEYANRQWKDLLTQFYAPRWEQFFAMLRQDLRTGGEPDLPGFEQRIRQWEWQWVNAPGRWLVVPSGDPCAVAKGLYAKYRRVIESAYHE